ncbi:hypothetical protein SNE40_014842 [Patella caerulea]|uniref:acylglycerol lipase n=1 Tax=Patella caerulea TaxID=87958 RepID=A0AAN8JIZ1_PATCE
MVTDDVLNVISLTVLTSITVVIFGIYFFCPRFIIETWMKFFVWWSGMSRKFAHIDGITLCYGEKGRQCDSKPTIIFLHGFSADHYMWAPIALRMPASYHMIALDQPGHGGSDDPLESEAIGYHSQVKKLYQFLQHKNLDIKNKLHIVGLSMGGTIGGLFAAEYPHLVHKLTICCPSMQTPSASQFAENLRLAVDEKGPDVGILECGLLPQNPSELKNMLKLSHYYYTSLPQQILQGAADMRKQRNVFFLKLFRKIAETPSTLVDNIHRINTPVQLIWGKEDSIIDISGLDVLKDKLVNCKSVDVIPCCGHAIPLDQPKIFTELILGFHKFHLE